MDNDLDHGKDLNFSKGHRVPLKLFVLKGKNFDYYNKVWRGLGYVTPDTLIEPSGALQQILLSLLIGF